MADEKKAADAEVEETGVEEGGSKKKLIMMIAIPIIAIVAIAIPAYFFLSGSDKPSEVEKLAATKPVKKKPLYFPLSEDFMVNISAEDGSNHLMRVAVTVMTRDQEFLDSLKESEPVVRNDLLVIFSEQNFDELKTLAGKKKLRVVAFESIKKSLAGSQSDKHLEAVLFTNFIME